MPVQSFPDRLHRHLARLYPPVAARQAHDALLDLCRRLGSLDRTRPLGPSDVWLIAYADHVHADGDTSPLQALQALLDDELADLVEGVHLLPFYPSTSDDGFAVVDPMVVDPAVGTWEDVSAIARHRRLMVDAVVNHVSASAPWVQQWRAGRRDGWVLEREPSFDTSRVVRPRTSPLFTPFEGTDGRTRWAWTTFSPDQVDLDYRTPDVLVAMTEVLLTYAARGAGVIRLDAIGYLWKASGTTCIHLPQTHEVVKLWRTVLDHCAPGTLLITETNVPHDENIGYFGRGDDEAHLVYQFPLAPLVLSAFTWGSAQDLTRWAASLPAPAPGTAFFNFLGSHDGIGVRPVEGLLSPTQVRGLCDLAVAAGGGVSHRAHPDGSQTPYELNTTFVDALGAVADDGLGVARIVAAHAILLALQGVPGLWFGGLFGVTNDHEGAARTGRLRQLNRGRVRLEELRRRLHTPGTLTRAVFEALAELITLRRSHPAFAPDSPQLIVPTPAWLFAVVRGGPARRALVVVSVSSRDRPVEPAALVGGGRWRDRLGPQDDAALGRGDRLILPPYGVAWLEEV
jgi:sucrose phosphorylase